MNQILALVISYFEKQQDMTDVKMYLIIVLIFMPDAQKQRRVYS